MAQKLLQWILLVCPQGTCNAGKATVSGAITLVHLDIETFDSQLGNTIKEAASSQKYIDQSLQLNLNAGFKPGELSAMFAGVGTGKSMSMSSYAIGQAIRQAESFWKYTPSWWDYFGRYTPGMPNETTIECRYEYVDETEQTHRRHFIGVSFKLPKYTSGFHIPREHPVHQYMEYWLTANYDIKTHRNSELLWHKNRIRIGFFFKDKKDAAAFKFNFHQAQLENDGLIVNGLDITDFIPRPS